jgi:hypothetical protein
MTQRESVKQETEADWLTTACDRRCAEPSTIRPPSYKPVTLVAWNFIRWSNFAVVFCHSGISRLIQAQMSDVFVASCLFG